MWWIKKGLSVYLMENKSPRICGINALIILKIQSNQRLSLIRLALHEWTPEAKSYLGTQFDMVIAKTGTFVWHIESDKNKIRTHR